MLHHLTKPDCSSQLDWKLVSTNPYSAEFYAGQSEGSQASANVILSVAWELIGPSKSVLDVGCGVGTWLSAAKSLGATKVLGLDGEYVDRDRLVIETAEFQATDFVASFPELGTNFDLTLCLEVAEHLPSELADNFVEFVASTSSVILFSAAIPQQGGTHHVNEQWPDYWSAKFEKCGFELFDLVRTRVWNDERVESWYRQNSFIFAKGAAAESLRRVSVGTMPLRVVHPDRWIAVTAGRPSLKKLILDARHLPAASVEAVGKLSKRVGRRAS